MTAAGRQRALAQAMSKDLGVKSRKNLDRLFGMVDGQQVEAPQRERRLEAHHGVLGNINPSLQNPATKVGEVFDVIGPYLVGWPAPPTSIAEPRNLRTAFRAISLNENRA